MRRRLAVAAAVCALLATLDLAGAGGGSAYTRHPLPAATDPPTSAPPPTAKPGAKPHPIAAPRAGGGPGR